MGNIRIHLLIFEEYYNNRHQKKFKPDKTVRYDELFKINHSTKQKVKFLLRQLIRREFLTNNFVCKDVAQQGLKHIVHKIDGEIIGLTCAEFLPEGVILQFTIYDPVFCSVQIGKSNKSFNVRT